jgi:hypothetical protein
VPFLISLLAIILGAVFIIYLMRHIIV